MSGERSPFKSLAILLVANAFPIGGVVWFLIARSRGEARLAPLPEGSAQKIQLVLLVLGAVVFLAWGVYPAMATALSRVRSARRERAKAFGEASFAGKLARGPGLAFFSGLAGFLWLDVLILAATLVLLALGEAALIFQLASSFQAAPLPR